MSTATEPRTAGPLPAVSLRQQITDLLTDAAAFRSSYAHVSCQECLKHPESGWCPWCLHDRETAEAYREAKTEAVTAGSDEGAVLALLCFLKPQGMSAPAWTALVTRAVCEGEL